MFKEETSDYYVEQAVYFDLNQSEFIKRRKLPELLNPSMVAATKALAAGANNSLMAFFSANAIFGIFSAYLLQYLWGMINALQMIVLTALFNVTIPFNAHMIMITVLSLVSLEFVDTSPLLEGMFEFRETESFMTVINEEGEASSTFEEAGYGSSNFLQLLSSIFFIILLYIAIQAFMYLLRLVLKPCGNNFLTRWVRQTDN